MKNSTFLFSLIFVLAMGFSACNKDNNDGGSCETVVNANGPAFLKVVNNYSETLQLYMGDFIPFGAELRSGKCEIYGLPEDSGSIEVSTLDGSKVKEVPISTVSGETVTITIDSNFF